MSVVTKPAGESNVSFKSVEGETYILSAIVLSHIYGEARESAKKLTGELEPNSITVYDLVRLKIVDHLRKSYTCDITLDDEVVYMVIHQMTQRITQLKKTCETSEGSPSS